jgi:hypothetical protein
VGVGVGEGVGVGVGEQFLTLIQTVLPSPQFAPQELSEKCRVSIQNKFEKLVRLVGFSIRICHEAWSHECKIGLNWLRRGQ